MRLVRLISTLTVTGAAVLALASPASAATPPSGSLGSSWTGMVTGSCSQQAVCDEIGTTNCQAPYCDEFALTVPATAVSGSPDQELTISIDGGPPPAPDPTGFEDLNDIDLYVIGPDMKAIPVGNGPTAIEKVVIPQPMAGAYKVRVVAALNGSSYKGTSAMATPPADPATTPPPTTPAPAPTAPPAQPNPDSRTSLGLRFGKAGGTAKALNKAKKLSVKITSTIGPITDVRAVLRKGNAKGAIVGTGSIKKVSGSATLTVRLAKKLAKGAYVLIVSARDSQNRQGASTAKVKVS